MSNEMSSFRQSRNKLNMFNLFRLCLNFERTKFHEKLVRHCCQKWQQCRRNVDFVERTIFYSFDIVAILGNKVECCFDKVERWFDIVAGVEGALDSASCQHLGSTQNNFMGPGPAGPHVIRSHRM